jgi:hypothetical protein
MNGLSSRVLRLGRVGLVSAMFIGLTVMLLLGIAPSEVQAGHLTCGSTVSGHVVFDGNLACSGNGLTVGADNTTIDLAGFTLSCTGAGYLGSCQGLGFVGINTNGFNSVLIKGGTITGFAVGVHVNGGSSVNVRDLTVTGPSSPGAGSNPRPGATGILVTGTVCPSPADTIINIHGNNVSNHLEGIELVGANCVNVGHNHVHDNNTDPVECHGIKVVNSGNNNFNNNLVERNGENLGIDGGLTLIGSGSANNTITHNDVSNNCGDGISARSGANNNQTVNNEARNNSTSNLAGQCFGPPPAGTFFDLAARADGPGNKWNKNNQCNTQSAGIPAGVCNPGE